MNVKVADFAEALQAEAEQLSLMSASPTSTTTASLQDTKKKEQIKAAALRSEGLLPYRSGKVIWSKIGNSKKITFLKIILVDFLKLY